MLDVAAQTFSCLPLIPIADARDSITFDINLPPNAIIPKGTLLGPVNTTANDVQTVTIGGAPTGGTFTVSGTVNGTTQTTAAIAFNATGPIGVQAALQALAIFGANVTVTGAAGGPFVATFAGSLAGSPVLPLTGSIAGLTGGAPTFANVHTTTGRSAGTYAAYASGNSDGSQLPRCLAKFDYATDATGRVTIGLVAGGGAWGETEWAVPAYFSGTFDTRDLVGIDATALTNWPGARLLQGTVTAGIVRLP